MAKALTLDDLDALTEAGEGIWKDSPRRGIELMPKYSSHTGGNRARIFNYLDSLTEWTPLKEVRATCKQWGIKRGREILMVLNEGLHRHGPPPGA
jgi:hypothetical protein